MIGTIPWDFLSPDRRVSFSVLPYASRASFPSETAAAWSKSVSPPFEIQGLWSDHFCLP